MKTDYEKQADDFLKQTGTKINIKFLQFGKHFYDDKFERDIYKITLQKGRQVYSFNFGQCLKNSTQYRVKNSCTLKQGTPPTAYDILACLQKYDVGTLENFCFNFGYDIDSRNAEKIYKAVCEEYNNLKLLFNDIEFELMQKIQ